MLGRPLSMRARRLLWFVALWFMGVAAVASLGYVIRLALGS